jgi:hypothetical protein
MTGPQAAQNTGPIPGARRGWVWLAWALLAAVGFGLTLLSWYASQQRLDSSVPWSDGVIFFRGQELAEGPPDSSAIQTRLRLLPGNDVSEAILNALSQDAPGRYSALEVQLRPKLIRVALTEAGIDATCLQSGRLPTSGRDEVLAGAKAARHTQLTIGGRNLAVVGVLRPDVRVFADSYLVPPSDLASSLFPADDTMVRDAILVRLNAEQIGDRPALRQLDQAYPASMYSRFMPEVRLALWPYYINLAGQAGLLLGGSGLFIGLFQWLARHTRIPVIAAPLQEMLQRPRLLWAVHLTYFGLMLMVAFLIYEVPEVPTMLRSVARGEIGRSAGPLGIAGKAYASGSIPCAAMVTFLINFLLGSMVMISLPSAIVPGCGVLMAALRALTWGCALAPTTVSMAAAMRTHSGTVLLEGEGYVLASFFALLVPIHIFQSSLGDTAPARYARVLLLNLKANGLVAVVLVLAGCYEAIEILWL